MPSQPPRILFIDAAKYFGWAVGLAGEMPESGSRFFAKSGDASHGACFAGAMRFTADMIRTYGTDLEIVVEEPLPVGFRPGKTNFSTTQVLFGLPACIRGMAFAMGCFTVQYVPVSVIRKHFIGKNPKGDIGKPLVHAKCLALGWISPEDDDQSFDRSDALAGWSYVEHQLAPKLAQPVDDLFVRAEARKRAVAA